MVCRSKSLALFSSQASLCLCLLSNYSGSTMETSTSDPDYYQPAVRWGHITVVVDHKAYMWGGALKTWPMIMYPSSEVEIFDIRTASWEQKIAVGNPPPALVWVACAAIGNTIYTYGGWDGYSFYNTFYKLDLTAMEWSEVTPSNPSNGPSRKMGCGAATYGDNILALFGGHTSKNVCTNELHIYKRDESKYMYVQYIHCRYM